MGSPFGSAGGGAVLDEQIVVPSTSASTALDTTLDDDPVLFVSLDAGIYLIDFNFEFRTNNASNGGAKWNFAFDGSLSSVHLTGRELFGGVSDQGFFLTSPGGADLTVASLTLGVGSIWAGHGFISVTAAGTLAMQFAQNSSSTGFCQRWASSYIKARKIG